MPTAFDSISNWNTFQNSFYIGNNLCNIFLGMQLLLYFKTMWIILSNRKMCRKPAIFHALFSSMMMFLVTIWRVSQTVFGQQMWLQNPDFPGGPAAYWEKHTTDWYPTLGLIASTLLQLMTDALMIHRCRIVWNSYRIIIVPIILWLASLVLGILMGWTSSVPGGNIFVGNASRYGLAYRSVSVLLNVISTCAICYRIARHGKRIREHLGREHASLYFTIITIFVESVLPYTITGIAFLVSYGMGSPTSIAVGSVHAMTTCISPQVLILRVLTGRALDKDATSELGNSTVRFDPSSTSRIQTLDIIGDGHDQHVNLYRLSKISVIKKNACAKEPVPPGFPLNCHTC